MNAGDSISVGTEEVTDMVTYPDIDANDARQFMTSIRRSDGDKPAEVIRARTTWKPA